jgi:hypothetical protein
VDDYHHPQRYLVPDDYPAGDDEDDSDDDPASV